MKERCAPDPRRCERCSRRRRRAVDGIRSAYAPHQAPADLPLLPNVTQPRRRAGGAGLRRVDQLLGRVESKVTTLCNTASTVAGGRAQMNVASRTRQSRLFTWSDRITPVAAPPGGSSTSNRVPIGQRAPPQGQTERRGIGCRPRSTPQPTRADAVLNGVRSLIIYVFGAMVRRSGRWGSRVSWGHRGGTCGRWETSSQDTAGC